MVICQKQDISESSSVISTSAALAQTNSPHHGANEEQQVQTRSALNRRKSFQLHRFGLAGRKLYHLPTGGPSTGGSYQRRPIFYQVGETDGGYGKGGRGESGIGGRALACHIFEEWFVGV
ncbi:hypothetical protein GWI33_013804 [Rhynchophorus ferrugineus]|uniref:Uncharacterized protein n=1 Tax=Rhynchophorus ferrugineus TaxID=354439 RepID=A0A834IGC9_RHYFE|nr:hypothetical protein GWI33_013804 [Rhynchophorus ferrugineus]